MLGWTAVVFGLFLRGRRQGHNIKTKGRIAGHIGKGRESMVARTNQRRKTNGDEMPKTPSKIGMALVLAGVLTTGTIAAKPACAEEEWRVGGMLQIPFGGSREKTFVHFANTRIGIKVQYAEVDDIIKRNEQVVERVYEGDVLQSSTVTSENAVTVDEGGKVVGGEGYLLVAPFNGFWDFSGGFNGFAGQETIQGAAGLGYDPSFGVYLGIGALLPYSEAGIRFNFRYIDYFVGATSLPKFASETVWQENKTTYNDISQVSPEPVPPAEEVVSEVPEA